MLQSPKFFWPRGHRPKAVKLFLAYLLLSSLRSEPLPMEDSLEPQVTAADGPPAGLLERHWPWWWPVPLYPYGQRQTLVWEVIPDWVWIYEQIQGVLYVVTPLRMTVIRLEEGGLLVYAPVAPTAECRRSLDALVARYGPVQYIVLPTISGIEHKVFVGPFARHYPQATVYVAEGQWSFPVNLPLSWLGLPLGRTQVLRSGQRPFGDRFEWTTSPLIDLGVGRFAELVLFDRRWQILLTTDVVVAIPPQPPEVVQIDPYPLLFHARDRADEPVTDTPAQRRRGWQRVALFTFYFRPGCLAVDETGAMLQGARSAPDRSRRAFWGCYPFHWQPDWEESFQALSQEGRLVVAPVLQQLILNRAPEDTWAWAEQVARWDFQQVISAHMAAPVWANGTDWLGAFSFLRGQRPLPSGDLAVLGQIDRLLSQWRVLPPGKT
jgi:hypothetical protein